MEGPFLILPLPAGDQLLKPEHGTSLSTFSLRLRQRRLDVTSGAAGQLERIEDDADSSRRGHPDACPVRRPHLAGLESRARACLARARKQQRADRLRLRRLLPVHKHVDDLCATAPILCVSGGNAGDSSAWPHPLRGVYLGERHPYPVHCGGNGNCPHAAPQEVINKPNVYRALIPL